MRVVVNHNQLEGTVTAPSSKSSMQRAVAAALMADGESVLWNPSFADDCISAINMAECLGAKVQKFNNRVVIEGGFNPVCNELDCGESGLGVRMFSALASLADQEIFFNGKGTILNRPMNMIVSTLEQLGVRVNTTEGRLPLSVSGPLKGGLAYVDGSKSSQFLTGLLMALPSVLDDTSLIINNLNSKPYIDLTIDILNKFNIEVENLEYKKINIKGRQKFRPINYIVEEDWSGVAFLAVGGALGNGITVKGVSKESVQADKIILDILSRAGASIKWTKDSFTVLGSGLKSFRTDITDCPDLAPPLVALAAFCDGTSVLTGTSRLIDKESDRASTLKMEFEKLGVEIKVDLNSIEIRGGDKTRSAVCNSHGDHRIAMALAIAGTQTEGTVEIIDAECINKSYPSFYEDIAGIGANIEILKD